MTTAEVAPAFEPVRELPNGANFLDVPHGLKRYDNKKIKCRCDVCKEARRAYDRERYQAKAEQIRQRVNDYRQTNLETERARDRARYTGQRKVEMKNRVRARYEADPDTHNRVTGEARRRRRATPEGKLKARLDKFMRTKGAPGSATPAQIAARVVYFGNKCAYCGGPYEHLDHVKALSLGGSNWPANFRPACVSCNTRKGAMPWKQFLSL